MVSTIDTIMYVAIGIGAVLFLIYFCCTTFLPEEVNVVALKCRKHKKTHQLKSNSSDSSTYYPPGEQSSNIRRYSSDEEPSCYGGSSHESGGRGSCNQSLAGHDCDGGSGHDSACAIDESERCDGSGDEGCND